LSAWEAAVVQPGVKMLAVQQSPSTFAQNLAQFALSAAVISDEG
jgi:hypothetical protein